MAAASQGRLKAMLEQLLAFRRAHRQAWFALSQGFRRVMFPAGTWVAWRYYGAMRVEAFNHNLWTLETLEAPS